MQHTHLALVNQAMPDAVHFSLYVQTVNMCEMHTSECISLFLCML